MKLRQLERYVKPSNLVLIIFIMGFIGGMIVSFIMSGNNKTAELLWLDTILLYVKYGEVQYGDMLFYIFKQRIISILIIIILCMSGKGKYILTGVVGLVGCFAGYFITEFVMAKGILGSVLFLVTIFPHGFFYAYAYYSRVTSFFHIRDAKTVVNQCSQKSRSLTTQNGVMMMKKIMPFAVVIIGILLECYVNPFFLKLFLKIFM